MKLEAKIYTERCIWDQIAAGGSGDSFGEIHRIIAIRGLPRRWLLGPSCVFGGACPAAFSRRCISEKSRRPDQCHPANIGSSKGRKHYDRQCDGFETVRT